MYVLGLHFLGHDLSCSLLDDEGNLVFVAEQERYSNLKGGEFVFHPRLVKKILGRFDIDVGLITHMALVGGGEFDYGVYEKNLAYDLAARRKHYQFWASRLRTEFPGIQVTRSYGHHQCHAASAYYFSGFPIADIYAIDGYGEAVCESVWKAANGKLELVQKVEFPHSVGYLYRSFATWLNLGGWEREGKLMALSSYGNPIYQDVIKKQLLHFGNPARIGKRFLSAPCKYFAWAEIICDVFGPGRKPDEELSSYHQDVAASIQRVFEDYLICRAQWIRSQGASSSLACAGGAFLNSKAVGSLRRAMVYDDLWVQPLASDTGLSIGACALLGAEIGLNIRKLEHLFLGEGIPETDLVRDGYQFERLDKPDEWVAKNIAESRVVGWCSGRMEVGPRALGNRSVLADARIPAIRDKVNSLKNREAWRPFAPAVLEKDLSDYVEEGISNPFMTEVQVLKAPELLPAVTHCDGTSRVQSVDEHHSIWLNKILSRLKDITGVSALLNTSLNVQGMPIARTLDDIILFYEQSGIDEVVINGFRLKKLDSLDDLVNKPNYSRKTGGYQFSVCIAFGDLNSNQKNACNSIGKFVNLELATVLENSENINYGMNLADEIILVAVPWYASALGIAAPRLAWHILSLIGVAKQLYTVSPDGYVQAVEQLGWVRDTSLVSDTLGDFEDYVSMLTRGSGIEGRHASS